MHGTARGLLLAVGALCAVLPLAACASASQADAVPAEVLGEWRTGLSYDGDAPFLRLDEDGTWSGSDGCNSVTDGRWGLDASGALSVDEQAMTLIGCDGDALPGVFSQADSLSVANEQLTLHLAEGDVVLVRPDADGPALDAAQFEGQWRSQDNPDVTLHLDADGALSGSDGCNRLIGSWEFVNGVVAWGDSLAGTRMFCPDVDVWLSNSVAAQPRGFGSWLRVLDSDGAQIGQLERVESDTGPVSSSTEPADG
ncbi:MAG: META domain-containing protein [Mycetocola sp.]